MRGSIIKKGKTYFCVFRVDGRQKWVRGGSTRKIAESKLTEILHQIYNGDYQQLQKDITFSTFANNWLNEYARPRIKESTFTIYKNTIEAHLKPYFGNTRLKAITPNMIESYITQKRMGGLSNTTIINHLLPFKKMLKIAVLWKYLKENPSQYLEQPRIEKKEVEILSLEETQRLLDATNPRYRLLFQTAIETGLRRGELLALDREQDLDFSANQIYVQRNLWHGKLTTPKSRYSVRRVDLRPKLMYELKKHIFANLPSKFIFPNCNGGPINADAMVRRYFKPALKKAGIQEIKFHALRHTNAAIRIASGQNIYYISRQLGHSSIKITLDLYGHLLKEVNVQEAKKLDFMLEKC